MDTGVGGRGNSSIEVLRCRNSRSNTMFIYPLCAVYVGEVLFVVYFFSCLFVAFENIRFSSLFAAGDVSRGRTSFLRAKRPQRRRVRRNGCFRRLKLMRFYQEPITAPGSICSIFLLFQSSRGKS